MLPEVLTAADLAKLLDCTEATVEDRTRDRQLPGLKFGRSWVYPREAVLRVLTDQALQHVAQPAPPAAAQAPAAITPLRMVAPASKRPRRHSPAPLPNPPGWGGG
jgi:hypothetical protein